jgi:putative flippase GtrA
LATSSVSLPGRRQTYAIRFGAVGLSGIVVNQLALALFTEVFGVFYVVSAVLATQASTVWNFLGTEYWVFSAREPHRSLRTRFLSFLALNNATLLLRIPLLSLFVSFFGINYLVANFATLIITFGVRFLLAEGWIWSVTAAASPPSEPEFADPEPAGPLRLVSVGPGEVAKYSYDVAGILRLDSEVALRELAYFRIAPDRGGTGKGPDISIRIGRVGSLPARRIRFVRDAARLSYFEQLGMAGANFRLTMGEPILIEVAPLLARSPHVLYTNVVEALLRFLLVSRGYVLLHSACIMSDGKAALLSAQTDTGKTSTVIQLVRDHGFDFLSDDMTIISPDGRAICYPKPMTLSYHTMSSIKGGTLRRRERAALAVQSRLHSKSGRSVGHFLGSLNIPIVSINSVVQILVPPPKYRIDALMACRIAAEAPIAHVFLMERGESLHERVTPEQAIAQLIENTDDAYGFPPFATFAPHITIGGEDYHALRRREEDLLLQALTNASVHRVRVPGHAWAELLPGLMGATGAGGSVAYEPIHLVPVMADQAGILELAAQEATVRETG